MYRQYTGTGNVIGTLAGDTGLYVLGPVTGGTVTNVGNINDFLGTAGCR